MMFSPEKNNFVTQHCSARFFEKDRELYLKTFPTSRIVSSLLKANPFQYENLDGRMLLELLDVVSPEEILKNRGIEVKPKNTSQGDEPMTLESAKELLSSTDDISALDYHQQLKPMVTLLIPDYKESMKKIVLVEALNKLKSQSSQDPNPENKDNNPENQDNNPENQDNTPESKQGSNTEDGKGSEEPDKKKEGSKPNTQG